MCCSLRVISQWVLCNCAFVPFVIMKNTYYGFPGIKTHSLKVARLNSFRFTYSHDNIWGNTWSWHCNTILRVTLDSTKSRMQIPSWIYCQQYPPVQKSHDSTHVFGWKTVNNVPQQRTYCPMIIHEFANHVHVACHCTCTCTCTCTCMYSHVQCTRVMLVPVHVHVHNNVLRSSRKTSLVVTESLTHNSRSPDNPFNKSFLSRSYIWAALLSMCIEHLGVQWKFLMYKTICNGGAALFLFSPDVFIILGKVTITAVNRQCTCMVYRSGVHTYNRDRVCG